MEIDNYDFCVLVGTITTEDISHDKSILGKILGAVSLRSWGTFMAFWMPLGGSKRSKDLPRMARAGRPLDLGRGSGIAWSILVYENSEKLQSTQSWIDMDRFNLKHLDFFLLLRDRSLSESQGPSFAAEKN